ncbi:creatininase family protein [Phytoactinopolyspora halotolerans]|uniref:Creatininase family protein n=1 Tax=Phytoactinopolyspora halotolerans TaxID=1981512 RepID=A0A6L9S3K8_9ACTN|nr:creatininase family protein [Phytoactinopolyspora halotolerans]NED99233.1 creatininase family protein [Phytoactinopolyspora halotolerans]
MTVRQLSELTWLELRAAAPNSLALLPIGSQEQHGGHLPLGTDQLLAETVVAGAMRELNASAPDVVLLPSLPYGFSPHHMFAAAVTLSSSTLVSVLGEILDSLAGVGFRRMMIVNGHGGNDEAMRLAVKEAALRADVAVGACNYWNVRDAGDGVGGDADGAADRDAGQGGRRVPGHAGWFETSLMLAAHPELVRARRWEDRQGTPPLFDRPPHPGLVAERHGEWARVGGVTDDPREASADAGDRLLATRVRVLAAAIVAFAEATEDSHGPS